MVFIKYQDDVNTLASVTKKFSVVFLLRKSELGGKRSEALAVGEWCEILPVLPKKKPGLETRRLKISTAYFWEMKIW